MKSEQIEKLDRQRYLAVILETAGLLVMLTATIYYYFLQTPGAELAIRMGFDTFGGGQNVGNAIMGTIQALLLPVGGLWYGIIWVKAKRSRPLHNALYNELYRQHKYRYQRLTLWVLLLLALANPVISALLLLAVEPTTTECIKVVMLPVLTILAGLLTLKISWLIFNRR